MRIGMIAPAFPPAIGGMEELARNLARALARTDDVTVCTLRDRHDPGAPFPIVARLTGEPEHDARELAAQETNVDLWLGMQASTVLLARRLTRPFFVYCHGNDFLNPWEAHAAATWVGHQLSRAPFFWRYALDAQARLKQLRLRPGFRHVRHAFANSHATAARLSQSMRIASSRVTVIPPGVDDAFFQDGDRSATDRLCLLTVSRLPSNSRKNVDGVLRAIAQLRDLPVSYTVVGDGDGRAHLEGLVRQLGLETRVRFMGAVDRQTLLRCYRESNLFILAAKTSTTDIEGFGIVYLEASASGVPVIASKGGGVTDAVSEGVNGLLLPSSEPDQIAAGIRRFWQTRESFSSDRVRAFADAFRWPRIASRLRHALAEQMQ